MHFAVAKQPSLAFWLAVHLLAGVAHGQSFTPEITKMIQSWAPLIWLHSGEQFLPSSVDFFLEHVNLQNRKGRILDLFPKSDRLPAGSPSASLHLQTRHKLHCSSCLGPSLFYGQRVANGGVPVYAVVRDYQDAWNTIDVVYHTFYPYNRGKQVCVGILTAKDKCLGNVESFGNHVGDWEHVQLRFQNGKPHILYLSVHNFGAYYSWDESTGRFQLTKGETPKQKAARRGRKTNRKFVRQLEPNFPDLLHLSGTHPVMFSANGSHGLWATPGKHTFSSFPRLADFTDAGIAWNTWENLVIIPWNDTPFPYVGELGWLNFRGRWGNTKNGCDLEPISGECRMNNGPFYPEGPDDMPPPRITRTRYLSQPASVSSAPSVSSSSSPLHLSYPFYYLDPVLNSTVVYQPQMASQRKTLAASIRHRFTIGRR